MGRPLLLSCALHVAFALIAWTAGRRPPPDAIAAPAAAGAVLDLSPTPPPVDVEVTAAPGGGGAPRPPERAGASVVAARRPRALRAAAAPIPEPPPLPSAVEAPPAIEEAVEPASATRADGLTAAAIAESPGTAGGDDADGAGEGSESGGGGDLGLGGGLAAELGKELQARVLGDEKVEVRPRAGVPIISHDEATALRARDTFPRLPESVWPGLRPYIVALEVCVAEDGRVDEAVLRSSASARLDRIVLAAVKTWRYRPRLVGGKPTPFCHGVVIKYDRW